MYPAVRSALSGFLVLTLLAASAGQAASNGQLASGSGASSSGSAQVGLVVRNMVRVSDVNDLRLQWDAAQQAFAADDGVCVFGNLSGRYSVTASSTEGDGSFIMAGEADSTVPYEVRWNGQALEAGSSSGVRSDANTTEADCDGDTNVSLNVRASAEQAGSASRTGQHADTLVLKVTAE